MIDRVRRSWLIVPADNEARISEAAKSGADVVVLDFQDTVHESRKHDARANARDAMPGGGEIFGML